MRKVFGLMIPALILSTVQLHAQNISREIPVDDGFIDSHVAYSGEPKAYLMKLKLISVGGKMELCGIGVFKSIQHRTVMKRGLRGSDFKVNGRTVLKGLNYFSTVDKTADMARGKANCRATGVATPSKIDSIDIDWGNFQTR